MNSYLRELRAADAREELRGRPVGIAPVIADTTCFIAATYEAKSLRHPRPARPSADAQADVPDHRGRSKPAPKTTVAMHDRDRRTPSIWRLPIHEVLSVDEMAVGSLGATRRRSRTRTAARASASKSASGQGGRRVDDCERRARSLTHFLAKVAADMQKPRGQTVISRDDIPGKLFGLKLSDWPGIGVRMERRFREFGVTTTEEMYQMSMADMRHGVFKSIQGERWWRLIRGQHVELPPIVRGQVGHSNVLAPEFRTDHGAYGVACRMVEKCGERLRWESLSARRLYVEVRSYEGPTWRRSVKFTPSNITRHFMAVLETIWQHGSVRTPSHVGVALQDVLPREDITMDLFGDYRQQALDSTTDALNRRFGRGTVSVASALASKEYLDHARIPFGKPTELR